MPERSERIILGLCVVAAAGHAALYIGLSFQRIAYPFELEWMESGSLAHLMRVLRGQPLYGPPSVDFVPFPYPPFYYYAAALVAKVVGPGFVPLRAVSLAASLGTAALIGRYAARESGRPLWGWIAAGIFLGTWRASGLYFDVARLDSLFTFLLLAAVHRLRFARGSGDRLAAAGLAILCVMTKQTAVAVFAPLALAGIAADWQAQGRRLRALRSWERLRSFALPLALGTALVTLALETFDGRFLRYVLGVQSGHGIKWDMVGWFFWRDLLLSLPLLVLMTGAWLGMLAPTGELRSRDERSRDLLHAVVLAGVVVACLVPRIKAGGAANNLIPVYAWLSVMLGVSLARVDGWLERSRPGWRAPFGTALALAALLQLLMLARMPTGYRPDEADLRAGRALAARVAGIEGPVWMPVQSEIAAQAGKQVFAHQMPVSDYLGSGLTDAAALRESLAAAVRERRFAAIVDSNTAFVRRTLPDGLLERHYRLQGWLFEDPTVLLPISGAQIRAGTLWLRREGEP